jgi:hypothetical protein
VCQREREGESERARGPLAGPTWPFAGPSAQAKERTSTRGWATQGARSAGPNWKKKEESPVLPVLFFFFQKCE